LLAEDKALVGAIWQSLPTLFESMKETRRGLRRFLVPLNALADRLSDSDVSLEESVYAGSTPFAINEKYAWPEKPREILPNPEITVPDFNALEQALLGSDLSLAQLLSPGFDDEQMEALANDSSMPFAERLNRILDTPAFQLR